MADGTLVYGGFSFCGVDIAKYGLSYAPKMEDTYVYAPGETQSHIETFEGHDGGYIYGTWYEPKEFTLRCFFEEQQIDRGILAQVYALFKPGRTGKLVFDRRPWCYYYATVVETPKPDELSNYLNGLITIRMKAAYPFARSEILTNTRSELYHDVLMTNSAVFDKSGMELPDEYTDLTSQTELVLCNQGTMTAPLGISIAGDVGSGVTIANRTTGQLCKIVALSKAVTTDVNKTLVIDPINGLTKLTGPSGTSIAFMYHNHGFLSLESSFPAIRDIYIEYHGGTSLNVKNILTEDVIGKYIFVSNKWRKIVAQPDKHTLTVRESVENTGYEKTMIIPLNELVITPVTTMDITSLKFIYKPTYA